MEGWQELKKNRKKGVSMAVVVCISAFFVAFSVAMVYTAGLLTAQANSKIEQEQSYRLAKSFSDVLEKELQKYDKYDSSKNTGTFYGFVNKFLDTTTYLEYNSENAEKTTYHYQLSSGVDQGKYGNIKIALRKEKNEDENSKNIMEGNLSVGSGSDYQQEINRVNDISVRQYIVSMDVTVENGDDAYTYTTEYYREEQYDSEFSHNGTKLYWNGSKWVINDSAGGDYDMKNVGESNPITYKMKTRTICRFKNVQEEAESN